jgi:GAF domain-containing protein
MKFFIRFGAYAVAFGFVVGVCWGLYELFWTQTSGLRVGSSPAVRVAVTPSGPAVAPRAPSALAPVAPAVSSAGAPATSTQPSFPPPSSSQAVPTVPSASRPLALPPRTALASPPSAPVASLASPSPILPFPQSNASRPSAVAAAAPPPSFEEEARRQFEEARRLEARRMAEEAMRDERERQQRQAQVAMTAARAEPERQRQSGTQQQAALRDESKEELENFFPWPPPPSSARITYPKIFADRKRFPNVGQAASFLEDKLAQAGFERQWSYFKLPDEKAGFGLVSKMEQIDPTTAKRLPGAQGWTTDRVASASDMAWWSWGFAIQRPIGQYRVFVLIVSTRPTPDKPAKDLRENEKATFRRAQEWVSGGRGSLTPEIAALPLTSNHGLTIRLYEFKQQDKGIASFISSPPLSLEQHLAGAGINLGRSP